MAVVLSSIDEAFQYLSRIPPEDELDRFRNPIEFDGELRRLEVVIEGEGFAGEITGEMARALAAYQDSIYTFAKVILHGSADIPYVRLSSEDRRLFQLSISVEEGCTLLGIDFKEVLKAAALRVREMDDVAFRRLIVTLAVIAATGTCVYLLGNKALDNAGLEGQRDHVEEVLKSSIDGQNKQLELLLEHFGSESPRVF